MTPIFIPMNYGSGNYDFTGMEALIILVSIFYITQIFMVWMNLFAPINDGYKNKLHFLYWHLPFIPCIVALIKKVASINKD